MNIQFITLWLALFPVVCAFSMNRDLLDDPVFPPRAIPDFLLKASSRVLEQARKNLENGECKQLAQKLEHYIATETSHCFAITMLYKLHSGQLQCNDRFIPNKQKADELKKELG